jgi:hypothetical protein
LKREREEDRQTSIGRVRRGKRGKRRGELRVSLLS